MTLRVWHPPSEEYDQFVEYINREGVPGRCPGRLWTDLEFTEEQLTYIKLRFKDVIFTEI